MSINPQFKIIADHLRSSSFLIADGILPSNEGKGYVLRRIMRRAMLQLHKFGTKEASMYKLVDVLIKEMGDSYPELLRAKDVIVETLKIEEERFRETLDKGLKILEEELSNNKGQKFSGSIAFKLYDTYGFPLDLTQDILKEKNIEVDVEAFDKEMKEQRRRAKENWSGSGEEKTSEVFFALKEKFGETKFLGYETLSTKAKILDIIEGGIILDQTPFYATSGGQKGDDGKIFLASDETKFIEIFETKKFAGNLFVHFFNKDSAINNLKVGDEIIAKVNEKTRQQRAQNHSATHLLHKALKEVLGNSITQKGSNVDAEYFTFDFNFNRGMSAEEIEKVENLVNQNIQENSATKTEIMPLEKARESGAEALFGEKYDNEVRVVAMANSIELCGGTHVKSTGNIGIFKIISEKGIAAGIRRIEAKSGFSVIEFQRQQEQTAKDFIEDLQQESKKKDKEIERLKKQLLLKDLDNLKSEKIGEVNFISHVFDNVEAKEVREILTQVKSKKEFLDSHIFAFFGCKDGKVSLCLAVSNNIAEKFDATKLIKLPIETIGGKGGGGKKDLAMGGGTNKNAIPQAIDILKKFITN